MRRLHGCTLLVMLVLLFVAAGAFAAGDAMNFKDADIRDVLHALGELGNVNVAADPQVQGKVTLFLRGMEPLAAIDLVVRTNGYSYLWVKDTIVVGPANALTERFEPTRAVFFPLRYVDPDAIGPALRLVVQPATVQADKAHRGVLVRGTEEQLVTAEKFLQERDIERQLELDFKDADVLTVFHDLAVRGGYSLLLDSELYGTLTILLQGIDVDEAIRLAARQSGVHYRYEGNSLIVHMDPLDVEEPEQEPIVEAQADATGSAGAADPAAEAVAGSGGSGSAAGSNAGPEPDSSTVAEPIAEEPVVVEEPRYLRIFTLHYIEPQLGRRLVAMAGAGDSLQVEEVGQTLLVRGAEAELEAVAALLEQYDLPQVRVDGIVIRADERLAVVSIGARSHVVPEGGRIHDLFVVSISDKEVALRTARGHTMYVPIGGNE